MFCNTEGILKNKDDKIQLFETTPIPRAVAALSIPTVVTSLVMILYNLADTYFVGLLNDPVQSAAVTLTAPVILAFNAVINLFGIGCSSLMSRSLGKKDYETVRRTSVFGIYSAIAFSALFSVLTIIFRKGLLHILGADETTFDATLDYMLWTVFVGVAPSILNVVLANMIRSEGASLHAGIGTMGGCILNVILDPIFILPWGLGMGAAGAGLATFVSNVCACIYFFVYLRIKKGKTFVSVDIRLYSLDKKIIAEVAKVGIPAAIQNLLNVTGSTILNNFTSSFGTDAVAAMGIAHKLNMVPMYVSMGMGQGIMPLVGYNYASGDRKRMKNCITFTSKIAIVFIVAASAAYYFCADGLIALFIDNESVVGYGAAFLRGFCLGLPFLAVDFLAVGIFQAVGKGKESLIFAIMRKVLLEIPALYILNRLFPLYGLAYSQLCAEVVLAVAAVVVLVKIMREKPQTDIN